MTDDARKTSLATIELLAEQYPQCFFIFEKRRVPLKVGIREDLIAALNGAITAKEAALALAIYCGNHGYLKACTKAGTPRIDLNGNIVGVVDANAADNAKQRLAQQKAKHKHRREVLAKAKVKAKAEARNAGRISLADLRKAAQARRAAVRAA